MGCIYEDRMDGMCQLATNNDGEFDKECEQQGSQEGVCVVSEDPEPGNSCEMYESDWTCPECGVDLNVDDCECDDE